MNKHTYYYSNNEWQINVQLVEQRSVSSSYIKNYDEPS